MPCENYFTSQPNLTEKEKQRKMRKKYEESLIKKKEDEEKLKQLKIDKAISLEYAGDLNYTK